MNEPPTVIVRGGPGDGRALAMVAHTGMTASSSYLWTVPVPLERVVCPVGRDRRSRHARLSAQSGRRKGMEAAFVPTPGEELATAVSL